MNCDKIGKFIATLRKKKGLTQKELADELNVTDRAVSKWERGMGCPDISLLEDLSKILDISIIELLKGEKINSKQKVDKDELFYSMNYAEISTKEKMCKVINTIIITLITIIILTIIFNNIKINILLNHRYYSNIMIIEVDNMNLFEELENKIELIKEEYINCQEGELVEIINIINEYIDVDQKNYNKEYYTFDDIKELVYRDSNGVNEMLKLTINNIGNKAIYWNMDITNYVDNYYDYERNLKYFIDNCYDYDYSYNIDESIGNQVKQIIYDKYYIYSLVLEDIINGGVTDE